MLRIAEMGRSGERYILSGPFVELGEIVRHLATLSQGKPPKLRIPFACAMALAAFAQTWSRVTNKPTPMSIEGIRMMNARLAVTAAKAQRELGVTFRPFEDTLTDCVAWAKARLPKPAVAAA